MENLHKRTNYFIKKGFQANFIVKFCLLIMAACSVLSVSAYLLSQKTLTTAFENSRLVIKSTADFILPTLLVSSTASGIIICLATIIVVLFVSHKIAGPIYRFEKTAEAISEGNLTSGLRIRKDDQLQPLASSLDEMEASLRNNISELKNIAGQLENNLNNPPVLNEKIKLLKQKLDYFKT